MSLTLTQVIRPPTLETGLGERLVNVYLVTGPARANLVPTISVCA